MEVTDPAFEAWLRVLPAQGYDRDWIRHNLPTLRKAYADRQGNPMPECPARSSKPRDRYEEL